MTFNYTSVSDMAVWQRPSRILANNRVDPAETNVWVVSATLVLYKHETDMDYHLVVQDDDGSTMIVEIPDPACVGDGSPFADLIANARAEMDAMFTVTDRFQSTSTPVTVTGIGFWDFAHGQTGRAPNLIELHPVLDIQFP